MIKNIYQKFIAGSFGKTLGTFSLELETEQQYHLSILLVCAFARDHITDYTKKSKDNTCKLFEQIEFSEATYVLKSITFLYSAPMNKSSNRACNASMEKSTDFY